MGQTLIFKIRITAILLIAAGYGWAGGHFIPADSPFYAYIFQGVIITILLVLSIGFFSGQKIEGKERSHAKWATTGLTIFTALTLIINMANIIHGMNNTAAFGSHNTAADLVPIGIIMLGDILWLASLIPGNKKAPPTGEA
jgi:hypothetical protein